MKNAWMLALCLGLSVSAQAGNVYKCNLNGSTVYQSRPCLGASTDEAFQKQNSHKNKQPVVNRQYQQTQQQSAQKQTAQNTTSNIIPDTAEGKKKSLAIAQEAYQQTKNR